MSNSEFRRSGQHKDIHSMHLEIEKPEISHTKDGTNLGIYTVYVWSFLSPEIFILLESLLEYTESFHCPLNPTLYWEKFKLFQDLLSPKAKVNMYSWRFRC
jgi:hypothetical protein